MQWPTILQRDTSFELCPRQKIVYNREIRKKEEYEIECKKKKNISTGYLILCEMLIQIDIRCTVISLLK